MDREKMVAAAVLREIKGWIEDYDGPPDGLKAIKARKAEFVEVVRQSLNSFMGESAASATIHQLGGPEAIKDPKIFAEKLRTLFTDGAELILKHILKNLETDTVKKKQSIEAGEGI